MIKKMYARRECGVVFLAMALAWVETAARIVEHVELKDSWNRNQEPDDMVQRLFEEEQWKSITKSFSGRALRRERGSRQEMTSRPQKYRATEISKYRLLEASPSQDTCVINSLEYRRGEALLDDLFETRCGPTSEFHCYCDPDANPPISCPFCMFENDDGMVLCSGVDEDRPIQFVAPDETTNICQCHSDQNGKPVASCGKESNSVVSSTIVAQADTAQRCFFDLADGFTVSLAAGEPLNGIFPTKCGSLLEDGDDLSLLYAASPDPDQVIDSSFSCICNPSLESQIECPFCGERRSDGTLRCVKQGSQTSVVFQADGTVSGCTCQMSEVNKPKSVCAPSPRPPSIAPPPSSPTPSPSLAEEVSSTESSSYPSQDPSSLPSSAPTFSLPIPEQSIENDDQDNGPADFGDKSLFAALQAGQRPSMFLEQVAANNKVKILENGEGCVVELPTGGVSALVRPGQPFGRLLSAEGGPCGPTMQYPFVCNPKLLPHGIDYPYCEQSGAGTSTCSKIDGDALLDDENGVARLCVCTYEDISVGPEYDCSQDTNRDVFNVQDEGDMTISGTASLNASVVLILVGFFTSCIWLR